MADTNESIRHLIARDELLWQAKQWLLGESGRQPLAGTEFLWAAVREITSLRREAAGLDFGSLNTFDYGGSRTRRARRYARTGSGPRREDCEAACRESYVLRGLEGLLRKRGVGLEFLSYVYASATAEPEPRWLPLDPDDPEAYALEQPLGGGFDERLACYPRTLRFSEFATHDEVVADAVDLYHTTDALGGWERRRPGPRDIAWRLDERMCAWWAVTLHVLRSQGRPAHRSSGKTNVRELFERVRRVAYARRLEPAIHARTYARWFAKYWITLAAGAPTVAELAGRGRPGD